MYSKSLFDCCTFCARDNGWRSAFRKWQLISRSATLLVLSVFCFSMFPAASYAETINYDGSDTSIFHNLPAWAGYSSEDRAISPAEGVNGNTVSVDFDGALYQHPDYVYGGLSQTGEVSGNKVILENGQIDTVITGGRSQSGSVTRNEIIINGGEVLGYVYGGNSESGKAEYNSVTMISGYVSDNIYVAHSKTGEANYNSLDISGGRVNASVYVARSGGNAEGNAVTVSGNADLGSNVFVADTSSGNVFNNKAYIEGGKIRYHVYAGRTTNGEAHDNYAYVTGGVVEGHVYGGVSTNGKTYSNKVVLSDDAKVGGTTIGGSTRTGIAYGNTAIIYSGKAGSVYGAQSSGAGTTQENFAAIYGGTVTNIAGAYNIADGAALSNDVLVSANGHVNYNAVGGYSDGGKAIGNTITMDDGYVGLHFIGGRSVENDAIGNNAILSGGKVNGYAYGGLSSSADATNNSIAIFGTAYVRQDAYGGFSFEGSAVGNTSFLSETGEVVGTLMGGYSEQKQANDNWVDVSGGTVGWSVAGGYSSEDNVIGNTVTMSGGSVGNRVFGGYSVAGDAISNEVLITGGITGALYQAGHVYGGFSEQGGATGNKIAVDGANLTWNAIGGYSSEDSASYNSADLFSGSVGNLIGGQALNGVASYNTATVQDGLVEWSVYGALVDIGNAENNVAEINSGLVSSDVFGASVNTGNATGNTVTISEGSVGGGVYGGYSNGGDVTGNTVTISGGSVGGRIYGGYSNAGDATGNTVNIIGAPTLSGCGIHGGWSGSGGEATSGNTFNFMGTQTISADSISNFENYNFWLLENVTNLDRLLVVDVPAVVDGATIDVLLSGGCLLNPGDKIALISRADDTGITGLTANDHCLSTYGSMVEYDFSIYADGAALWAELARDDAAPESGTLTDSRLAGAALLSYGADLVSMLEYFEVSRDKRDASYIGFAAVMGGSSTYDVGTGREIDADSFALMAGVMWDAPVRKNSLRLRAFVEAGWSDYDMDGTYSVKHVRGDGDANYYGVGVHARYQWTDEKISGLYTDASLRIGRIDSDFSTTDVADNRGVKAAYDTDSPYYGAHIGVGHIWKLNDRTSLDLSSKFLWTHIGGDEFTMSTGDRVELDSVNSSRWRTGFRVTRGHSEQLSLFAGAYYEYEFDGDSNGRVYGQYRIDKASLSGGSGIGELGLVYRPANNDRLSAMVGVQGYVGTREGYSGRLKLEYSF